MLLAYNIRDPTTIGVGGMSQTDTVNGRSGLAARRDLAVVSIVVLAYGVLAIRLELSEVFTRWSAGYEAWQLDELTGSLFVVAAGLAWFAFRRMSEARRELRERIAAEARVARLLEENRALTRKVLVAQEEERLALARDLHDELGQRCTALRAEASLLQHAARSAPDIARIAERIASAADTQQTLARDLLRRLRPPMLDSLGLDPALQELCRAWEEQHGVECAFLPSSLPERIDDYVAITVYRLVQEALTNVARHAGATRVTVRLNGRTASSSTLELDIADDGRGMASTGGSHPGLGLEGMRERVASLAGSMTLAGEPGRGVRIAISLPVPGAAT